MKRRKFAYSIWTLVLLTGIFSCTHRIETDLPDDKVGLRILPHLLQQTASTTKAKDDTDSDIKKGDEVKPRDELRENYFRTLDVFVKRQDDAETDPWFKEYHLTETSADAGIEQVEHLLETNWAEQGYVPGVKYDIYATANNPHTASGIASLKALKELTTTKPLLYKYYAPSDPGDGSNYITVDDPVGGTLSHKSFIMDGKLEGWQVDPSTTKQVFDMELARAAAKILIRVRFDGESEHMAIVDEKTLEPKVDDGGNPVHGSLKDYLAYNKRSPGLPRAKYVRFNFTASDIADGGYEPATGSLLIDSGNFVCVKDGLADPAGDPSKNVDCQFSVVTYSYPFSWAGHPERIPYVLLSVFYAKDDNPSAEQTRSYYRIPVCDESVVTSLDRNKIYIVDVTLASMGSSNASMEALDEELRIEYHVIPWTETNMTQEATTVRVADTKYLMVTPLEQTLKGDGKQSVDLQYFASIALDDGRYVDIDQSSIKITYVNKNGVPVSVRGTVTKTPSSPDGRSDIKYTCTAPPDGSDGAQGEVVTITVTPSGLIRVESEALLNRAVKTIEFDVELKNGGLDKEHVTIRHYPLDNIQSIEGSWSSRWVGTDATVTVQQREYTLDFAVAQSWGTYYTDTQYEVGPRDPYTSTAVRNDGTPTDNIGYAEGPTNIGNNYFSEYSIAGNGEQVGNGESSAIYRESDGYYYWGEGTVTTTTNTYYYDYRIATGTDWWGNATYTYYRYQRRFRAKYNKTHYYATGYWHNIDVEVPSTGEWVDWERKTGTRVSEGIYDAKIYDAGYCKYIVYDRGNYSIGNPVGSTLTNNHMYVIQITSTSNKYSLGKPVLDGNYQSQDRVASPAFMIASQLGAVTPTDNPVTASTHCGTYMEVGTDGTRYVGWRLPTKQEIEVIIGYQNGTYTQDITMVEVLGGRYYWALDGTSAYVSTGSQGSATNAYVRCVRDLTVEELNKLNK